MTVSSTIKEFSMGADPEFVFVKNEEIHSASEFTSNGTGGEFGTDGCATIFEVRPEPAYNPLQLVHNLHNVLFRKAQETSNYQNYLWQAGSFPLGKSLGGHIHFGMPKGQLDLRTTCGVLSDLAGSILCLIEDKKEGRLRHGGSYGGRLDMREQPHGFEWRTPSSWLTSPYVAAGILCLSKAIVHELLNNPSFKHTNRFTDTDFAHFKLDKFRENFADTWTKVTKLQLYPKFKQHIDLLEYLVVNNMSWFPKDQDMKAAWGLVHVEELPKKKISLSEIWSNYNRPKFIV